MKAWFDALVGSVPRLVHAVFLDKTVTDNWELDWHQDLRIAVNEAVPFPGFGRPSEENGIPQVQAPAALLERMLILRLHLDACDERQGAMRIVPGTHTLGHLRQKDINRIVATQEHTTCVARCGDMLAMRPLLLHASPRSTSTASRRVLHLQFAAEDLPPPLQWHESLPMDGRWP
jgi:ectoine hydroxylase-related dioxygenase (phytanoyl-CoA dioxygenase family)